jgi:hypothetical protein
VSTPLIDLDASLSKNNTHSLRRRFLMQSSEGIRDRRRRRSVAWVYYAILTVAAVVAGFSKPEAFLAVPLLGGYCAYLYRGGSIVVWLW